MSSTPLFDAVSRRTSAPAVSAPVVRAAAAPAPAAPAPAARASAPLATAPVPSSPLSAPVPPQASALVPAALVAAIDEIPARLGGALGAEHAVSTERLALVEAVADAITRAVVDAVVGELDRITRDGVVRA